MIREEVVFLLVSLALLGVLWATTASILYGAVTGGPNVLADSEVSMSGGSDVTDRAVPIPLSFPGTRAFPSAESVL